MALAACVGFDKAIFASNFNKALELDVCDTPIEHCYEVLNQFKDVVAQT